MRALLVTLCAAWSAMRVVDASILETATFQHPYDRINAEGDRYINDTWLHGGDTDVKKHFIRLTTDRQSKRGFIWQRDALDREVFSAIMTFRISGVGKQWFGDGIALWFTDRTQYEAGPNHGFTDKYKGVGVVINTFKNTEHRGGHKDISVQVNDGTKTLDQMNDETRVGCDAVVRYCEETAAFDPVHSISRLKVKIDHQRLVVEVDPKGDGHWTGCHDGTLPFSRDWLRQATIGITASTGALADNHDIIRFVGFTEFDDELHTKMDTDSIMHSVSREFKKWIDSPNCGTECLVSVLQREMTNFRLEAEHRFSDLKEKTDNLVYKLQQQDKDNARRLQEVEDRVSKSIDSSVVGVNSFLDRNAKEKLAEQVSAHKPGGWKMPFFLLALALGGVAYVVYRKYRALLKSHLL